MPEKGGWPGLYGATLCDKKVLENSALILFGGGVEVNDSDPRRPAPAEYLRALRPQQWLKNALIFVPGLAGHVTAPPAYGIALLAFIAFCLCASAAYVLNDLADVAFDREHPAKRLRPFASGALPAAHGMYLVPLLLVAALALALWVSPAFVVVLAGYCLVTLADSFWLKRILMLDVVVLACLYGLRVVAGGVAFGVPLSEWLVAFSVFLFLCLALIKRAAELAGRARAGRGDPPGRAYRLDDLPILEALSAASGFAAIVVLALYVNNPVVAKLYGFPQALWGIGLVLAYWLSRLLILTHRADMHDDPVAFAATDANSLVCAALLVAIGIGASL